MAKQPTKPAAYDASAIEVLEGLEAVRKRPGMYIGGTDARALHHMAAEILDNAMDEAVAGHAKEIRVHLAADNTLSVSDDGRGIPVDPHPKYPKKSALEVILTELHSGGKFSGKAYETSGGLHGVGASVVNALSESLVAEVWRDGGHFRQAFARGRPLGKIERVGRQGQRRGTTISFRPDPEIFKEGHLFDPARLHRMCRSKAYLERGVTIRWSCDPVLLGGKDAPPAEDVFHFAAGLEDFVRGEVGQAPLAGGRIFSGQARFPDTQGRVEWAIAWPEGADGAISSYCNTIPTPQGGTHEAGFRAALYKAIREYGERVGEKRSGLVIGEDVAAGAVGVVSVFIRNPQFSGQTKEKLASADAARLVEGAVKDAFDLWLGADKKAADALLAHALAQAEARLRRRAEKDVARQSATRRLRLPGKLADCTSGNRDETEIFLVEGDSAGGSAKQARRRETQAVLPLRGKILNVAAASADKLSQNQELQDLAVALGAGTGARFRLEDLRYGRVIIMTDADVDGAHIATLLMTYFWREMRPLVQAGRLYLARPPLYRLASRTRSVYAMDDAERDRLLQTFKGERVEVSRFKGLGEMPPQQLRETTMDPERRTLLKVDAADADGISRCIERLMGRKAENRFRFIQENASRLEAAAIDA
jgi:topoisomerase-4 subunit B